MLEAALSRVSSMKRETCIVHNYMAYDGVLEKARLGQAASEWKAGRGLMGNVQPKFVKDADVGELQAPKRPVLKMCTMQESGFLEIPRDIRDRWLQDPVRNADWRTRLKNFDKVFDQASAASTTPPKVTKSQEAIDLSTKDATTPATETQAEGDCETPPSISHEQFTKDYPNTSATVTINLGGQQLTCHFVNDKVFLGSSQKGRLPGIASSNAKPVFAYAGGQWLSDSSKDKFVTKNIEVIMEEQGSSGAQDSAPMTLHEAMVMMEKRGMMDLKVSGHSVERPAAVKRGDEPDTLEVSHQSYLVFKPNPVTVKNVKGSNIAGFVGFKVLSSSR
ncbi:unnamed protein product, partial [Durusdinium trenchii]